ncbi:MAG: translation initiation factor IF-3, partial [Elusimicrobia bacterium]|nr:translation initiation factor IF-3 [Elusimicrobiota bacterium]
MAFPRRPGGFMPPANKSANRINEYIRVPQVRLIDADGAQLGIKPTAEALAIAR